MNTHQDNQGHQKCCMKYEHTASRQSGTPEMLYSRTPSVTRNAVLKNTKCHHKCCTQEHQVSPQMLYSRTPSVTTNAVLKNTKRHHKCCTQEHQGNQKHHMFWKNTKYQGSQVCQQEGYDWFYFVWREALLQPIVVQTTNKSARAYIMVDCE